MLFTNQCLIPYKGYATDIAENANFNIQLASLRIVAEQVIGHVRTIENL